MRDIKLRAVCLKISSYVVIFSLIRDYSIRESAYVHAFLFSAGNKSPR